MRVAEKKKDRHDSVDSLCVNSRILDLCRQPISWKNELSLGLVLWLSFVP